ncbi:hypothetical protein ACFV0R_18970 [Streptomyces sp. NPDC059578]|uniref:hypothetical protein n=1 Tax=Streptomyces sp. NPDC059578 TaxID=3346874 RepID=UPI0036AE15B7
MPAAAPAAAPRHHHGDGATGTRPAGRRGQRVRVPWRVVAGPHEDVALAVYIKVTALAARPEGCTAAVKTLATFLGMSARSVSRGLTPLITPDADGVTEISTTRRTLPGGTGDTAERRVRPLDHGELYVWLPVAAADTLTPRLLRLYAVLTYATARRIPTTDAELAGYLRHHSGPSAGQPISTRTVARLRDELEDLGWITVDRHAGHQGRHAYTVHRHPLHLVPAPAASPDTDGDTAADTGGDSLTSREDRSNHRPEKRTAAGGARRRRDQVVARGPVEKPQQQRPAGGPSARYTGPPVTFSGRVHDALAPVRDLVAGLTEHPARSLGRAVGRLLDTGLSIEQVQYRLDYHRGTIQRDEIRSPAGWLLDIGLLPIPSPRCNLAACEGGWLWLEDRPCKVCAEPRRRTAPAEPVDPPKPTPRGPRPQWHTCTTCRAPSREPWPAGRCTDCTNAPAEQGAAAVVRPVARQAAGAGLDRACPEPECRAPAGHRCRSGRGRPRAAHTARTTPSAA